MPTKLVIPERRETVCAPCKFHHCTGSMHIRTGGGWREYACEHPQAFEPTDNVALAELNEHARVLDGGRYIGKTEKQPQWCPLLRDASKANSLLNEPSSDK